MKAKCIALIMLLILMASRVYSNTLPLFLIEDSTKYSFGYEDLNRAVENKYGFNSNNPFGMRNDSVNSAFNYETIHFNSQSMATVGPESLGYLGATLKFDLVEKKRAHLAMNLELSGESLSSEEKSTGVTGFFQYEFSNSPWSFLSLASINKFDDIAYIPGFSYLFDMRKSQLYLGFPITLMRFQMSMKNAGFLLLTPSDILITSFWGLSEGYQFQALYKSNKRKYGGGDQRSIDGYEFREERLELALIRKLSAEANMQFSMAHLPFVRLQEIDGQEQVYFRQKNITSYGLRVNIKIQ